MTFPVICIILVIVVLICILFGGVSSAANTSSSSGSHSSSGNSGGSYVQMLRGELNNGGQKYCDVTNDGDLVNWCAIFVGWSIKQIGKEPSAYGFPL